MFKNRYFNMTAGDFSRHSKYAPERIELHNFNVSDNRSLGLEYATVKEAYNARNMLKLYATRIHMPMEFRQRKNFVIATRPEKG